MDQGKYVEMLRTLAPDHVSPAPSDPSWPARLYSSKGGKKSPLIVLDGPETPYKAKCAFCGMQLVLNEGYHTIFKVHPVTKECWDHVSMLLAME